MPFTNPGFPGQLFKNPQELEDAISIRRKVEANLALSERKAQEDVETITKVTATIIPASAGLLEHKISAMERRIERLENTLNTAEQGPSYNKEGIEVGTVLRGESKGTSHTREVLDEDYLCSDGGIYPSLSAAALGVSGNRRSGWKFWRDIEGTPIGEVSGRFKKDDDTNLFDPRRVC
jgi:hypothetical protein